MYLHQLPQTAVPHFPMIQHIQAVDKTPQTLMASLLPNRKELLTPHVWEHLSLKTPAIPVGKQHQLFIMDKTLNQGGMKQSLQTLTIGGLDITTYIAQMFIEDLSRL